MNNVPDVQQHPRNLSQSLPIRSHARATSLLLCSLCIVLAQPALAGVNQWTKTGVITGNSAVPVRALAVDPITPSTLYATGMTKEGGVFKSIDSGASWNAMNTGLEYILTGPPLVVDHAAPVMTPTTIYVGSAGGVYKSTNGGDSWVATNTGIPFPLPFVGSLAMDPVTHSTLYAGLALKQGLYKSTNGGASWVAVNTGLPITTASPSVLVVDPVTPATLYVIMSASNSSGTTDSVFKSADGGTNWSAAASGLSLTKYSALIVDPVTPATLYAGGAGGVFKSTNGGISWAAANAGLCAWSAGRIEDVKLLVVDPVTTTTLWVVTSGLSMFKSTDGGTSWIKITAAFDNIEGGIGGIPASLVIDPLTRTKLYGASWVGNFYTYTDDATTVTPSAWACSTQPTGTPPPTDTTTTPPPSESNGNSGNSSEDNSGGGGGGVIDPALLLLALSASYYLARRRSAGAA